MTGQNLVKTHLCVASVSDKSSSAAVIPQQIKASSREMAKKAEEGLEESVSKLVDISTKLEQDQMETGVDEKEWVSLFYHRNFMILWVQFLMLKHHISSCCFL